MRWSAMPNCVSLSKLGALSLTHVFFFISYLFNLPKRFFGGRGDVLYYHYTSKYAHCRRTVSTACGCFVTFPRALRRVWQLRVFAFAAGKSQGRSEETRAAERVSVCNSVPGKSFEAALPAWVGEEFKKCEWKLSSSRAESAGKEVVERGGPRPREGREGSAIWTGIRRWHINEEFDRLKRLVFIDRPLPCCITVNLLKNY